MPVVSPYPPSFGGNAYLYGFSFASLLCIGLFGLVIVRWMMRDIWRDRFVNHPISLLFAFRFMMLFAGLAAFIRCAPEVAYMTCFGDPAVNSETMDAILTVKRVLDVVSLPVVATWMLVLVFIYPFIVIALRIHPARGVRVDPLAFWPRLVRPALIVAVVVAIAALMAVAKSRQLA